MLFPTLVLPPLLRKPMIKVRDHYIRDSNSDWLCTTIAAAEYDLWINHTEKEELTELVQASIFPCSFLTSWIIKNNNLPELYAERLTISGRKQLRIDWMNKILEPESAK